MYLSIDWEQVHHAGPLATIADAAAASERRIGYPKYSPFLGSSSFHQSRVECAAARSKQKEKQWGGRSDDGQR